MSVALIYSNVAGNTKDVTAQMLYSLFAKVVASAVNLLPPM